MLLLACLVFDLSHLNLGRLLSFNRLTALDPDQFSGVTLQTLCVDVQFLCVGEYGDMVVRAHMSDMSSQSIFLRSHHNSSLDNNLLTSLDSRTFRNQPSLNQLYVEARVPFSLSWGCSIKDVKMTTTLFFPSFHFKHQTNRTLARNRLTRILDA